MILYDYVIGSFLVRLVVDSLVPRRSLIEKNGLIQAIYTDHLKIEQARKGTWGRRGKGSFPLTSRPPQAPLLNLQMICIYSLD